MPVRKVFTVAQVAELCSVSERTVRKWFDSGRLNGYKIPGVHGPKVRRIPRGSLIRFLRDHRIPVASLDSQGRIKVLSICVDQSFFTLFENAIQEETQEGIISKSVLCSFDAGSIIVEFQPDILLIDLSMGKNEGIYINKQIKTVEWRTEPLFSVALASEDETDLERLERSGFDLVMKKPVDPSQLASRVLHFCQGPLL